MKRFDEIEQRHGSSPVVTDEKSYAGSGTLILNKDKSEAVIQSDQPLLGHADDDGWFELRLKGPNGRAILLHNALITSSTQHHSHTGRSYEEHIYPNSVVLGADALVNGNKVESIAFTMRDLGLFFHYQHVESHFLIDAPKDLLAALRRLRSKRDGPYDLFKPRELFVVHQFPKVFTFKANGHQYEIFIGSTQSGLGWEKIDFQTDPIASIIFDKPVGIDEAIDAAWQWKRFFGLVALRPVPWTSLSARSGRGRKRREAEFYLPNHEDDPLDMRQPFSLWLGNVPLNRWAERRTLADVMRRWIEKEDERRRFRSSIENVAKHMRQRSSLDDIVTLCAGIESLTELKGKPALSASQAKLIAEGAIAAAKAHDIPIEDARIRGVIGGLQNQSLGQRLKILFEGLSSVVPTAQAKILTSAVLELRQIAAHGVSPGEDVMPKTTPAIEGLACACALYDLVTCGMPTRTASAQRVGLLSHLTSAIFQLEQIKNHKAPGSN